MCEAKTPPMRGSLHQTSHPSKQHTKHTCHAAEKRADLTPLHHRTSREPSEKQNPRSSRAYCHKTSNPLSRHANTHDGHHAGNRGAPLPVLGRATSHSLHAFSNCASQRFIMHTVTKVHRRHQRPGKQTPRPPTRHTSWPNNRRRHNHHDHRRRVGRGRSRSRLTSGRGSGPGAGCPPRGPSSCALPARRCTTWSPPTAGPRSSPASGRTRTGGTPCRPCSSGGPW